MSEPPLSVPSKGGSSAPAVQGEHATAMSFAEALATEPEQDQEARVVPNFAHSRFEDLSLIKMCRV